MFLHGWLIKLSKYHEKYHNIKLYYIKKVITIHNVYLCGPNSKYVWHVHLLCMHFSLINSIRLFVIASNSQGVIGNRFNINHTSDYKETNDKRYIKNKLHNYLHTDDKKHIQDCSTTTDDLRTERKSTTSY